MRVRYLEIRNFRGIKSLSWATTGNINCIIGSGDACKTTILTALDFGLSPRTALAFDDADFFNQVVDDDIVIQVTLSGWDPALPHIKRFFQESKFARYQCGLGENGPPLRKVLGDLAHQQKWIKRMDYSRKAFEFALPRLPDDGVLKQRLASRWDWVQSRE